MAPNDEARLTDELSALRRYARALTRDPTAADDLVQETLVRAHRQAGSFQRGRSLRAWLFAILHNQFVSDRRRQASEQRRNESFAIVSPTRAESSPIEQSVYLQQVAVRFAALPEEQRAVLHLIAVEGLSYQLAAEALDVPIGTVMSRLSRARAALRREAASPPPELRIVRASDA